MKKRLSKARVPRGTRLRFLRPCPEGRKRVFEEVSTRVRSYRLKAGLMLFQLEGPISKACCSLEAYERARQGRPGYAAVLIEGILHPSIQFDIGTGSLRPQGGVPQPRVV